MKPQFLLFSIFLFNALAINADPLLVAVLMVKNEAPVMQTTLQPLVDAGITDFLIYDTGSTDNTIQVTQSFFFHHNITNFVIQQGEWIDFATSRNKALELTEQHFPNATFMLMLDAEWILHNGKELLHFCEQQKNETHTLYFMKIKVPDIDFYHPRLIRCRSNIIFVGKVHEVPNVIAQEKISDHIYCTFQPTEKGLKKSHDRCLRDRDLLFQEIQENPNNERATFFLAHTYFCLGDLPNAIEWFEHRATMSGYDEENFLTLFSLAHMYHLIGNEEKMINNYLKAFCMRPHRAEPLIRLAEYYYNTKSYHLCYLFARHAVTLPYPSQEVSLIEKQAYEFTRYALLSATAYMFHDFTLGKQATLKALQAYPDQQYLYENLKYYDRQF